MVGWWWAGVKIKHTFIDVDVDGHEDDRKIKSFPASVGCRAGQEGHPGPSLGSCAAPACDANIPSSFGSVNTEWEEPVYHEGLTTVMIRNLPNDYLRDKLKQLMDEEGFEKLYDFIYLPSDFKRRTGLGYAFVNMVTHEDAERVKRHFAGFTRWGAHEADKACEVVWGTKQGLNTNVEYYRNNSVMHPDIDEVFKPAIFENGKPVKFPEPDGSIKFPRMKFRAPAGSRLSTSGADGPA